MTVLWLNPIPLQEMQRLSANTAATHCGIQFTALGEDWLEATIPLDEHTRGPGGDLHPGALGMLAETVGSVAASLCIDNSTQIGVGLSLSVNHPVVIKTGPVVARATAIAISENSHIWNIDIKNPSGMFLGAARLTIAILDRDNQ